MRGVGQSVHRARLVQRAQSVRQRRIGGLLVSVRFQKRQVETKREGFQAVLASIGQFQRAPVTAAGDILSRRLHHVAQRTSERLEPTIQREVQLAAREGRLQQLKLVAERVVERGAEREKIASHQAQRVSESNDSIEVQGQESDAAEGIGDDELRFGVPTIESLGGCSPSVRREHPDLGRVEGPVLGGGTQAPPVSAAWGGERRPSLAVPRPHQPIPVNASVVVSEVVIEAPLPQSSGSVEIVHSPSHGVSVRVSTRGGGTAAALRRSCYGMRDSLHHEQVRVSAIDVVEEET